MSVLRQAMVEKLPHMSSTEVLDALERSYDAQSGYVFIREITIPATGMRRADAIALQTYQSRGIGLHGFEVKVNRSDWLKELRTAAKAEELFRHCLFFSLVTPAGLVDATELPPDWGLLEVRHSDRKVIRTVAPKLLDAKPLDLPSLSLILRRAYSSMRAPYQERHARELTERFDAGREYGRRAVDGGHDAEELASLKQKIADFEATSGIDIRSAWTPAHDRRLGTAVRFVLENEEQLEWSRAEMRRHAEALKRLATDAPVPIGGYKLGDWS